ncbi:ABC transporter ATP-binding protein [Xenophilus azovorans]|uniref:ABC transporter ATP-binding protein n=1 Tax=Xenophilus azovorans TaxID=151755 RepID=UPI00056E1CD9|nr:ABC transporter ATP-binding protein [Xenophilus azovorans]
MRAEGLCKSFGLISAVHEVNLSVKGETIHGLIGPNGAGKTTVFNLLTKTLLPTKGRIFFHGRDITTLSPADVARLGIVRSFQISALFPHMTVRDNLRIALQRRAGLATQFWLPMRSLNRLDDRADELIATVGLGKFAERQAVELPYGRKRALELATTFALDPAVMLLDEPMAGLAHEDIEPIGSLIKTMAAGRTVVMIEHNLNVVARICDRISVLQRGEIIAEGSYDAVSADPQVRLAYMGNEDDE